jgi:hypothetical protein
MRRVGREAMESKLERLENAVRRGLALLERGQVAEARQALAAALSLQAAAAPAIPLGGELRDDELDTAFDQAETNPAEMVDATEVVRATLEREGPGGIEEPPDEPEQLEPGASPFATRTMVELLERQGDAEGARALRASIAGGGRHEPVDAAPPVARAEARRAVPMDAALVESAAPVDAGRERRVRVLATLERWLANVRRGVA